MKRRFSFKTWKGEKELIQRTERGRKKRKKEKTLIGACSLYYTDIFMPVLSLIYLIFKVVWDILVW